MRRSLLIGFGFLIGCSGQEEPLVVPEIVDPPRARASSAPPWNPLPSEKPASVAEPRLSDPPQPPEPHHNGGFPPPPPPTIFLDQVEAIQDNGPTGTATLIVGADGPREALFIHTIKRFRAQESFAARPICLTQATDTLVSVLAARFDKIHSETACTWEGPGVVLARTGEGAMFVHANIACGDKACNAEGGGTYGNMGAEGYGYRLRLTREGWTIEEAGIQWVA
ncbi:MAG: hypothetical protein V2J51_10755 [Erythrobacter sp.]|jgi:hypothetical protein|nr:hypothetical protein [Erythrobacter sp.]